MLRKLSILFILIILLVGCGINQSHKSFEEENLIISENNQDVLTNAQDNNEIQPKGSLVVMQNVALNGSTTSIPFQTSRENPFYKVWVYAEKSSGEIRVSVTKKTPGGTEMGSIRVKPGTQGSLYCPSNGAGVSTFYINCSATYPLMNGKMSCRIASSYDALN